MVLQVVSGGADEPCELGQRCSTTRERWLGLEFSSWRGNPELGPGRPSALWEKRQEREAM
jgi:hypothetical protein